MSSLVGGLSGPPTRLHHYFERSAARSPAATALIHEGQRWTYGDLEYQANKLARQLIRMGIRPGHRIGLLFERSHNTYVSLLAALKCGAVFVPLDPSFPPSACPSSLRMPACTSFSLTPFAPKSSPGLVAGYWMSIT